MSRPSAVTAPTTRARDAKGRFVRRTPAVAPVVVAPVVRTAPTPPAGLSGYRPGARGYTDVARDAACAADAVRSSRRNRRANVVAWVALVVVPWAALAYMVL